MKTGRWELWDMALPVVVGMILCGGCDDQEAVGSASPGAGGDRSAMGTEMVVTTGGAVTGAMTGAEVGAEVGAVIPVSKPEARMWSPEDAGFARYLPADTSWYFEGRQLDAMWTWIGQFEDEEVVERVTEVLEDPEKLKEMAEDAGVEGVDEVNEETLEQLKEMGTEYGAEGVKLVRSLFGEEVFVAVRGLGWWTKAFEGYQDGSSRRGVAMLVESLANGEFNLFDDSDKMEGVLEETVTDLMKLYEDVDRRPVMGIQMGGKVGEEREEVLNSMRRWLTKGAEEWDAATPHTFEKGGVRWTGMSVDLRKIDKNGAVDFEQAEDAAEEPEEQPKQEEGEGGEALAALQEGLLEMPVVLACAEVGDYVVFYAGYGEHSLEIEEKPETSLAGCEEWKFLAEYPADSLLGLVWLEKDVVESAHRQGSWEPVWQGVADGLDKSSELESGPEMSESARRMAALAKARAEGVAHASLGALVLDGGLRWESRGGWHGNGIDLDAPLTLAGAMRDRDDTMLMRAHWKVTDEYRGQGVQTLEEIVKMMRLVGVEMKTSVEDQGGADDGEEDADQDRNRELAELFEKEFVKGMEDLWTGYRDYFLKGVESESALVVDLAGELPPVPGIEEEMLDNGRVPRVAFLRPVRSRESLAKTWELWRKSGVRMLGVLSETMDRPIPFPDTLSADKDDLRTYFFAMPFVTEDFLPCVSVSDELFLMGTSKKFSEELYEAIVDSPADGEIERGVIVEFNGAVLWDFCETWYEVSLKKAALLREMNEEENDALGDTDEGAVGADDGAVGADEGATPNDSLSPEEAGGAEDADALDVGADVSSSALESLMGGTGLEDAVRKGIEQARWFRGASYRQWLDDGVPRSSTRIQWGDPMDLAE